MSGQSRSQRILEWMRAVDLKVHDENLQAKAQSPPISIHSNRESFPRSLLNLSQRQANQRPADNLPCVYDGLAAEFMRYCLQYAYKQAAWAK